MSSSSSSSPEIAAAKSTDPTPRFSYKDSSHDEVMEELSSRFILNLPEEELASLERVCFQVEQAHWFYEDFIREENPKFPSLPLKKFSAMLFHACPLLHQWSHDHEQAFNNFMQYKTRVPVCGAIMLNDTWEKCVLVKGWKSSSGWGFPKGKINESEPPPTCAIREVLEETGYNLAGQLVPQDVIEMSIKEQKISLFIVPGVPEDFPFKTKTRKEISRIEWFKLTDLPTWKRNKAAPGRFYLISPFIGALKVFINERKPRATLRKAGKVKRTGGNRPQPEQDLLSNEDDNVSQSTGDLQTQVAQHTHTKGVQANGHKDTDVSIDPHFARLLSSLTMSASTPLPVKSNPDRTPTMSQRTPIPADEAPTSSAAVTQSYHNDWSSSAPSRLPNGSPKPTGVLTQGNQNKTSSRLTPGVPSSPSHPTENNKHYSRDAEESLHSVVSPRMSPAVRRASTADISPYLSRPTEIPTSAKTLQQIALLESVANEAAMMTPFLNAPATGDSNGVTPSTLVPSHNLNNHRILYSSTQNMMGPAGMPSLSAVQNANQINYDPYQVRSRTSQAYHRHNLHPTTASMNQTQLLSLMNVASAPPPPTHQGFYPPTARGIQYPAFHTPAPVLPFRGPPHNLMTLPSYSMAPYNSSYPAHGVSEPIPLQTPPVQNNPPRSNPLLSILNAPRPA